MVLFYEESTLRVSCNYFWYHIFFCFGALNRTVFFFRTFTHFTVHAFHLVSKIFVLRMNYLKVSLDKLMRFI